MSLEGGPTWHLVAKQEPSECITTEHKTYARTKTFARYGAAMEMGSMVIGWRVNLTPEPRSRVKLIGWRLNWTRLNCFKEKQLRLLKSVSQVSWVHCSLVFLPNLFGRTDFLCNVSSFSVRSLYLYASEFQFLLPVSFHLCNFWRAVDSRRGQWTVDVLVKALVHVHQALLQRPGVRGGLSWEYEIINQSQNRQSFPLKGYFYSMGTESSAVCPILRCLEKRPRIPWCERVGSNKVQSDWSIQKGIVFFLVIM